jgi:hypothetical protein
MFAVVETQSFSARLEGLRDPAARALIVLRIKRA